MDGSRTSALKGTPTEAPEESSAAPDDRYRLLTEVLTAGFVLGEVVPNRPDGPVDIAIREVNPLRRRSWDSGPQTCWAAGCETCSRRWGRAARTVRFPSPPCGCDG